MAAISSTMASARTFLHDERGHVLMDSPPPFPFPVASTSIKFRDTRRRQNIPGEGGHAGSRERMQGTNLDTDRSTRWPRGKCKAPTARHVLPVRTPVSPSPPSLHRPPALHALWYQSLQQGGLGHMT